MSSLGRWTRFCFGIALTAAGDVGASFTTRTPGRFADAEAT
jgi:hypothetical protein